MAKKIYDFDADAFRWAASPTANGPTIVGGANGYITAPAALANVTQIAAGGGYTQVTDSAGGLHTTPPDLSTSRTAAVTSVLTGVATVFTATGAVAAFQHLYLIDDTVTAGTAPANPVIGHLDHGSSITMANTDTYTIPASTFFTIGSNT
jgi:hypothetical protein